MGDIQTPSTNLMQASPSSIVPPGSANPTIEGARGEGRGASLPKRVVTLETIRDQRDESRVGSRESGVDRVQEDGGQKLEIRSQKSEDYNETSAVASSGAKFQNQSIQQLLDSPSASSAVSAAPSGSASTDTDTDTDTDEDVELPDLTPEQLAFLTSERYREASSMIKREFGMEDDDLSFLAEMEHAVLGNVINVEQFIIALRGEFPHLNDNEKSRLIGILLAYRFEPFAEQLKPTPQEAARNQNIKLAVAPYYRIYSKPLTFRGAAHEIARMAGIDLMGQAQERLRDAIISRMKGIRTDGQIEELFMRPPEQAGLGLPEDKARFTREALVELIGRARLLNEDEYAKWLNEQIHHKQVSADTANQAQSVGTALHADEEKEIADIASRMPVPHVLEETVLSRAVASVIKNLSWKPTDDYLMRRLENTISTRLRDVRSRNEVFIKLMRDDKVGGLGLERKQAEKIAEEIEAGYSAYRGAVSDEEKEKVKQQLVDQERKVEERKRRESEEHAKWFEEKIKGKQDTAKSGLELLKVIARGQTTPIHPLDAKEVAKEKEMFGSLVEASKTGAVTDTATAMAQLATAFKEGKANVSASMKKNSNPVTEIKASIPPKVVVAPSVKVSVETARAAQKTVGSTKPKMQDITPVSTKSVSSTALSGPLQEIGQMTLEHFRRLASDPKASAKRVIELVEVIGHESYERKTAATEAWRSSPLQKQYLQLVAAAFIGKKSVTDIAAAKRAAGELAPTPEEIMAIIDLNRALSL